MCGRSAGDDHADNWIGTRNDQAFDVLTTVALDGVLKGPSQGAGPAIEAGSVMPRQPPRAQGTGAAAKLVS